LQEVRSNETLISVFGASLVVSSPVLRPGTRPIEPHFGNASHRMKLRPPSVGVAVIPASRSARRLKKQLRRPRSPDVVLVRPNRRPGGNQINERKEDNIRILDTPAIATHLAAMT
jgi:hypothetical protein